jgi:AhpD family alkylhydroperoxidase
VEDEIRPTIVTLPEFISPAVPKSRFLRTTRLGEERITRYSNSGEVAMNPRINYNHHSPELIKKLFELSQLSAQSSLGPTLTDLVHIRASQLNGCAFCLDMHVKEAKIHGERELRLYHIAIWRESPLFSDKERAALEWTEAVTRLSAHIPDSLYEQVRVYLSEKEMADLTFAIGIINFWNRLNISSPTTPGSLDAMLGLAKAELK